ncbi:autotransporter-associated_beta strand repeat-containing protein [Hexamita inflata]|uniref:Autotransporter-associated beta strand repeat-containing protein n=1 Tax=Hexamita inflata TaxID=28002 RepID=A0AA86NMY3_9EUKA|nr:autotransporter-associated beta strand repeat-containing protein [Hexamita inflata]
MLQAVKRANLISFSNNILVNNSVFTYGQKSLRLNTVSVDNDLYVYKESAHLFLYTEHTQQTHINVKMNHVNVFAVFGFNIVEAQKVIDSNISILINFEVITGALLCISCDIQVYNSTLVFQASGRQISGVMIQSISNIQLVSTSLQFRFNSSQTSGIVNMVNSSLDKFELSACKLIGTNLQSSENNGYISSSVFQSFTLTLNSVQVCVNGTNRTGANSSSFVQIGTTDPRCDICQTGSVVYGLCLQELHFGTLHDGMLQCIFPFEFVNEECRCAQGFLLNVSACIHLVTMLGIQSSLNNSYNETIIQSIQQNLSEIATKQNIVNTQLDNYILNILNISQYIHINDTLLDNNIINNMTLLRSQLIQIQQQIDNNYSSQNIIIQQLLQKFNELVQKFHFQPNIVIDNSIVYDEVISTNISMNVSLINEQLVCYQPVYATSFDIASVTHPVGPASFANGYAIASGSNISNAFIDVQDNAYATVVYPLFQNQNSFTNIKIQIGTQVAGAGSLLSAGPTLAISRVNIVSKDGSQITVNATFKLSILAQNTTSVVISDLLLNLSFSTATQGNISLIESATGVFNVTGFQVLGAYQSQGCVALGANTANTSAVFMNNISFAPSAFNVGNQSSYLFSYSNSSIINLNAFSMFSGSAQVSQLTNISSNSSNSYQFGGLISELNSSYFLVTNLNLFFNVSIQTQFSQFGVLIGRSALIGNYIELKALCINYNLQTTTTTMNNTMNYFGIIGYFEGVLHVLNSNILLTLINNSLYNNLGAVGIVSSSLCKNLYFYSLKVNVNINQNTGSYVGALIGFNQYPNCTILNSSVQNTNMNASSYSGGFMGYSLSSNVFISHCSIFNSSILAVGSYSGGFIGYAHLNITIQNSSVQNSNFSKKSYQAGFVGCLRAGSILLISIGQVFNSNIRGTDFSGAFVGCTDSGSYVTISDGLIFNNSIIATTQIAGGFIGAAYSTYNVRIVISKLIQTTITTPLYYSMTIGYVTASTVIITTSVSEGDNFINGVKQQNCLNYVC